MFVNVGFPRIGFSSSIKESKRYVCNKYLIYNIVVVPKEFIPIIGGYISFFDRAYSMELCAGTSNIITLYISYAIICSKGNIDIFDSFVKAIIELEFLTKSIFRIRIQIL